MRTRLSTRKYANLKITLNKLRPSLFIGSLLTLLGKRSGGGPYCHSGILSSMPLDIQSKRYYLSIQFNRNYKGKGFCIK